MVYVPDASRSVSVATTLMGDGKDGFTAQVAADYTTVRERVSQRKQRSERLTYSNATEAAPYLDWTHYQPPIPAARYHNPGPLSLADLIATIDWTPFFITWDLHGKFPAILEDPVWANRRGNCTRMPAPCWNRSLKKIA